MTLLASGCRIGLVSVVVACCAMARSEETDEPEPQYHSGSILIPAASAEEPKRLDFSAELADRYLTDGALAWSREHQCVSCHTTGSYLAVRGALTAELGPPPTEIRDLFIEETKKLAAKNPEALRKGANGTGSAYVALGLAEWDAHVNKTRSPETDDALRTMLVAQTEEGSWANPGCWPPLESSEFHGATVAALAVATAPGWLAELVDERSMEQIEKLRTYLRETEPPHDYARLLLLWAGTRMADLVDGQQKNDVIEMVFRHQREDGGWSLRTFATPEQWGDGGRAQKLRDEPDLDDPASDGHMTGLAVLVLRDAGVPAEDARIQAAVHWLKTNQRESGRWWTRSLNTDTYHFITFSSTGYALLALAKCNAL